MGLPGSISKVLAVQTGGHNSEPNTHIQSRYGGTLSVRDPVCKTRWRAIENCVFAGSGWDQKKNHIKQTKSDSEGQICFL